MRLDPDCEEAQHLLTAGLNYGIRTFGEMPYPNIQWFRYPDTKALCAIATAPTGTITVMYAVKRSFEKLVDTITPEEAARIIGQIRGRCRAYVVGKFTPGPFATIEVIDADGSGRATTELRMRVVPAPGIFVTPHQGGELRSEINVGITWIPDEGRVVFTDCDYEMREIRNLTPEEVAKARKRCLSNDDIAVFYHTSETLHGRRLAGLH